MENEEQRNQQSNGHEGNEKSEQEEKTFDQKNIFKKPSVDEQQIMSIMAGENTVSKRLVIEKDPAAEEPRRNKKEYTRPKKLAESDYYDQFFKIPMTAASKGKSVYIRPEFHQKFLRLISVLEIEKLTIYAYVDNIIEHHFQEFEEQLTNIYQAKNKPLF
ncbi:DUF3408 domain-containing protein [Chryseobacterium polytrichastri]|uniref:DUF3408 domain-containing protein n=1 Tax=Chryseobacterium polytrichastri TaxID=1302687 RepID=A0A1M7K1N7_9FLAO|nr:DUF3408 domain-containing protein [Chryseobacterium polytrichastri]SHM59091.1 Protein of unknown function [Chryseobacterium polytrichastri]